MKMTTQVFHTVSLLFSGRGSNFLPPGRSGRTLTLGLALALGGSSAFAFDAMLTDDTTLTINGRTPPTAGALATLSVDATHTALLKFDLNYLPPGLGTNQIYAATLKVFVNKVSHAGAIRLQSISGSWSEEQTPSVTLTPLPGSANITTSTKNTYVWFDVTALVRNWITGSGNYGLAIAADPGQPGVKLALDSKESIAGGHSATLTIDLGGPGLAGMTGTISSSQISANAVCTSHIADGAVTTPKVADGAVTAAKLAANAVGTAQIADRSLTTAKLADSQVTKTTLSLDVASSLVPPGAILPFAGPTNNIPQGWLLCDGAPLSRAQYSGLFNVIQVAWGTGDQVSTFNLPDLRGLFLRGVDLGAGRDPDVGSRIGGPDVGSYQLDMFLAHSHAFHTAGQWTPGRTWSGESGSPSSAYVKDGSTDLTGGSETRPVNVYVNYIIKY